MNIKKRARKHHLLICILQFRVSFAWNKTFDSCQKQENNQGNSVDMCICAFALRILQVYHVFGASKSFRGKGFLQVKEREVYESYTLTECVLVCFLMWTACHICAVYVWISSIFGYSIESGIILGLSCSYFFFIFFLLTSLITYVGRLRSIVEFVCALFSVPSDTSFRSFIVHYEPIISFTSTWMRTK